jgi:hypothetical protein
MQKRGKEKEQNNSKSKQGEASASVLVCQLFCVIKKKKDAI